MKKLFKKIIYLILIQFSFIEYTFCQTPEVLLPIYLSQIDTMCIKSHLEFLAHDWLEGRESGERGQWIAGLYLKSQLQSIGFEPLFKDSVNQKSYFQYFTYGKINPKKTFNVGGILRGTDLAHEYVILSAHYDHLGLGKNGVYNGADDNASGSSTILEIARIFAKLKKEGFPARRSIIVLFFSAEEKGLIGSEYFVDNSPINLQNAITNLNVDMVGRIDENHQKNLQKEYVYIIGSNFISNDLHLINEKINSEFVHIHLDYQYNNKSDKLRLYYRSDHYNFAKKQIPVIFYFSGLHEDYHKVTDTYDKIIYDKTLKIAQLIFGTSFYIAYHDVILKKNTDKDLD